MPALRFEYHPTLSPPPAGGGVLSVYFLQDRLLLPGSGRVPWAGEPPSEAESQCVGLGTVNGVPARCAELMAVPAGWSEIGLRDYLLMCDADTFRVVATAAQLLYWARAQNFCSRCGQALSFVGNDRALVCPACRHRIYPVVSPCVIVLVHRPGEILLARSHRMKKSGLYSCVAGFVEVGESVEEAVHREVLEEVGVTLGRIRYAGSQSWPFPHQLMLGFLAEYAAGELTIDASEIDHAGWFSADALPPLPPPQTIASRLIRMGLEAPVTTAPEG